MSVYSIRAGMRRGFQIARDNVELCDGNVLRNEAFNEWGDAEDELEREMLAVVEDSPNENRSVDDVVLRGVINQLAVLARSLILLLPPSERAEWLIFVHEAEKRAL